MNHHQLLDILRINMIEAQFYHHLVPIYLHQCQANIVTRGCISDRRLVRIEAFQENDLGVMVELMDSKQARPTRMGRTDTWRVARLGPTLLRGSGKTGDGEQGLNFQDDLIGNL